MAQSPITPVETLEEDLSRASGGLEVHYLDDQNERREARGSSAYIEMRLVMPQSDGQAVVVAFERVLLAIIYEQYCSYCYDDSECNCSDGESRHFAHWVAHYGRLVRLP
jgi:hypothetical protein